MLGLYIHVPFCASICNYCNFSRGLFDSGLKQRYVDALRHEIAGAGDGAPVDTIYFGGGTPSLLEPGDVAAIISTCRAGFAVAADAEITLEANPETVNAATLDGFRAAGVNRLSYGVQSFRDDELERLTRRHSAQGALTALDLARRAGYGNISLDLMMWLPQQSTPQWLESVEALIGAAPEHASMYMLEIYPNAPLREAMARGRWSVAPDDDVADMYLAALERTDRAGYTQYEISNIARPGRESRHNLKYWTDGEWRGFGSSAHSTRHGVRWRNQPSTEEYISAVVGGGPVVVEERRLTPAQRIEEALFTGLRLAAGLDLEAFEQRYGVDVRARYGTELAPFEDAGLLCYQNGRMRLTRQGMLLAHDIMAIFIDADVR